MRNYSRVRRAYRRTASPEYRQRVVSIANDTAEYINDVTYTLTNFLNSATDIEDAIDALNRDVLADDASVRAIAVCTDLLSRMKSSLNELEEETRHWSELKELHRCIRELR